MTLILNLRFESKNLETIVKFAKLLLFLNYCWNFNAEKKF